MRSTLFTLCVILFALCALPFLVSLSGCGCDDPNISAPPPDPCFGPTCIEASDDDDDATDDDDTALAAGCLDYDDIEKSDCNVKFPTSAEEKGSIDFGLTKTNVCTTYNMALTNSASISRPLVIEEVKFEENDNESFSIEGYKALSLKPGKTGTLVFKYCPAEGSQTTALHHNGEVNIKTNVEGAFTFELTGSSGMPDLRLKKAYDPEEDPNTDAYPFNSSTMTFDFGLVGTSTPQVRTMELVNYGLTPIRLHEAFLADNDYSIFKLISYTGVEDIQPGLFSPFDLLIECAPEQEIDYFTTLYLVHDDPISVELTDDFGGGEFDTKPLSGADTLVPGFPVEKTEPLNKSLQITEVPVKCTGGPAGCPVSIPKIVAVSKGTFSEYIPEEGEEDYQYEWLVAAPVMVTLSAEDTWDPEGDPMVYNWFIKTEGAERSIPYGSNAGFDGVFGNTDSSMKQTDFVIDVVGTYIIWLQVSDNTGTKCDPIPLKLVSMPSQKVHIELMWSTPMVDLDVHLINTNAVDPANAVLWSVPCDAYWDNRAPDWGVPRVIQPGDADYPTKCSGQKDPIRWACEYADFCEEPANQSIQTSCEDDPTLDIDNTHKPRTCTPSESEKYSELCAQTYERDCFTYLEELKAQREVSEKEENEINQLCHVETGPENINIVNPKPGAYLVSVHYFAGVFNSEARVRIYLNGKLKGGGDILPPDDAEGEPVKIESGQLWDVAYIDWPENPDDDPTIRAIGAISVAPPQTGDITCELAE